MPRVALPLIRESSFKEAEKIYILAFEGEVTEPTYFEGLRNSEYFNDSGLIEIISINRPPRRGTDPVSVKNLLKEAKEQFRFNKNDEYWIVVDRDDWETIHKHSFDDLVKECEAEENFYLALSNPCFELWILLHFVDAVALDEEIKKQLLENARINPRKKFVGQLIEEYSGLVYSKTPPVDLMLPNTHTAIVRAKSLDDLLEKYPKNIGTHVYKLVEKLIR